MTALLVVHAFATLYMVGLVWFVQVVHYPMFADVPEPAFAAYSAEHSRRTSWVVGPPMLAEGGAALVIAALAPSPLALTGAGLVLALAGITLLVSARCHGRLALGFDAGQHRRLVTTNWLRTALWTARGAIALALLAGA
ncbi:MAG: hypothetical protein RIB67_08650 [Miltoncostaeaceae bacterium]